MSNYDDFDLDLKKNSENLGTGPKLINPTPVCSNVLTSIVEGCTPNCITMQCSKGCPTPTKDRPAASCHKMVNGMVQPRC